MAEDQKAKADGVDRILKMVSEGRVTPEQGAELLRALQAAPAGASASAAASPDDGRGGDPVGREGGAKGMAWGRRPWRGRLGEEGMGIDLAALGRIGRHVAMRVERELDGVERTARRALRESEDNDDPGASELLWQGETPADGRLFLDVDLHSAGLRLVRDAEATEVRAVYRSADVAGLGLDASTPRVRMEGGRLIMRQRGRVMIGIMLRSERLTVFVPPSVRSVGGVVHSQNGGVRADLDRIDRLEIRLQNGGVRVTAEEAEELEAHSVNGAIALDVGRAQTVRATSHNGRIDVAGGALRLDADAGNGRLVAEPRRLSADAAWRLNTGNGRLTVHLGSEPVGLRARLRSAVAGIDAEVAGAEVRWLRRGVVGAEAEVVREAEPGSATLELLAKATNGRVEVSADLAEDPAGPRAATAD